MLRDALAAALQRLTEESPGMLADIDMRNEPSRTPWVARLILSDPAFREALVEAVADGMYRECPCNRPSDHKDDADLVVERMLTPRRRL